jgi:hypothetical protein
MPNRHKSYDDELAKKFEDMDFARNFLINQNNVQCSPLDEALRETIKGMGLLAFSEKSGLSIQAVSDFVSERQKWSTDKLIKKIGIVFNLKVSFKLEYSENEKV